jgi:hypothetical protein
VAAAKNQATEVDEALENAQFKFHLPKDPIPKIHQFVGEPNSLLAADHVAPKADAVQPNKVGADADEPEPEPEPEPQPENNVDVNGNDSDETVTELYIQLRSNELPQNAN